MVKRRRLTDLYVRGKEVSFPDPEPGQPDVVVWLQKINPLDHEETLRKASAARAKHLTYRNDKESEEYQAIYAEVADFSSRETLVELVLREEIALRRMRIDAEVSANEEWSEDDYLQGLYDAWNEGLKDDYARDKDHPEAKRVFEELKRFTLEVEKLIEGEKFALIKDYESTSEEVLMDKAVQYFVKRTASTAFMSEYEVQELYSAARLPENHSERYFENVEEVKALEPIIRQRLVSEYQELVVDPTEGKKLEEPQASSLSPEQPEPQAMGSSSGLKVVSQ